MRIATSGEESSISASANGLPDSMLLLLNSVSDRALLLQVPGIAIWQSLCILSSVGSILSSSLSLMTVAERRQNSSDGWQRAPNAFFISTTALQATVLYSANQPAAAVKLLTPFWAAIESNTIRPTVGEEIVLAACFLLIAASFACKGYLQTAGQ